MRSFIVCTVILTILGYYIGRIIRKEHYFSSEDFLAHKSGAESVVTEYHDLLDYLDEICDSGVFSFGLSRTGKFTHLATSSTTRRYQYRHERYVVTNEPHVYQASLAIVAKARQEPMAYLMKYFGFTPNEATLSRVEEMGESLAQLEDAAASLRERAETLIDDIHPPRFIAKHYASELRERLGITNYDIEIPYPHYVFEYVSPTGSSIRRTEITLTLDVIDVLIKAMSEKIVWRQRVSGQRALMTRQLREQIKERDRYACRYCGVSVTDEPHLLLEVDHIIPVSRGGQSQWSNLQTLCWKCNRTKSNNLDHEQVFE